jgi:hypothetical protein
MLQFNRVFGLAEIPPRDVRGMNKKHWLNGKDRAIRNRQKMCTTLYTTNPTWATVSLKSGLRGKAISTDRHRLTTALQVIPVEMLKLIHGSYLKMRFRLVLLY